MGFLSDRTGNYTAGTVVLAVSAFVAGLLILSVRALTAGQIRK